MMRLAIGQIGAELEAPAHLVNSGQHRIADLESLFKTWLSKEINRLQIDLPSITLPMGSVTLSDLEIVLPDIDLHRLQSDPESYFKAIFQPAFNVALAQQLSDYVRQLPKNNYALAAPLFGELIAHGKTAVSKQAMLDVVKACELSLHHRPLQFLSLVDSAEWPSLRKHVIDAFYKDEALLAASLAVISEGVISSRSMAFLTRLSESEHYQLWLDIELLRSAYASSLHTRQRSLALLVQSYQFYKEHTAFNETVRESVANSIKTKPTIFGALSTWFAVKGQAVITTKDCKSLLNVLKKVSSKTKALPHYRTNFAPYHSGALTQVLEHRGTGLDLPQQTVEIVEQGTPYLLAQIRGALGGGCRQTIRALERLIQLLAAQTSSGELPYLSQIHWRQFIAKYDIEQTLPVLVRAPIQRLLAAMLLAESPYDRNHRASNRVIHLIARERKAIEHTAAECNWAPKQSPKYARRIFALLCQITNIPSQFIVQFNHYFTNVFGSKGSDSTKEEVVVYSALLEQVHAWLSNEYERIEQRKSGFQLTDFSNESVGVEQQQENTDIESGKSTANEHTALRDSAEHMLSEVSYFEPSMRVVFDGKQRAKLEQIELLQLELTLSVLLPQVDETQQLIVRSDMFEASATKLKQLIASQTKRIGQIEHSSLAEQYAKSKLNHLDAQTQVSVVNNLLSTLAQVCEKLGQIVNHIRMMQQSTLHSIGTNQTNDLLFDAHKQSAKYVSRNEAGGLPDAGVETQDPKSDKPIAPSGLVLARELVMVTQLKRYMTALQQVISASQLGIQLHACHEVVVKLLSYVHSWKALFPVDLVSPAGKEAQQLLSSVVWTFDGIRKKLYALNPYLPSQLQKSSMWWVSLLDEHQLDQKDTKDTIVQDSLNAVITREADNQAESDGSPISPQKNSKEHLDYALQSIGQLRSAKTLEEVKNQLVSYELHKRDVKHTLDSSAVAQPESELEGNTLLPLPKQQLEARLSKSQQKFEASALDKRLQLSNTSHEDIETVSHVNDKEAPPLLARSTSKVLKGLTLQVNKQRNRLANLNAQNIKTHSEAALAELKYHYQQSSEHFISVDAGVVLLWPFLEILFNKLALLDNVDESGMSFESEASQHKAHALLCDLVGIDDGEAETFVINALLGLPLEHRYEEQATISEQERDEITNMVNAAISRWEALKGMPADAFKSMFLQRAGEVKLTANGVCIVIDSKPQDILLMKLPWGLGIVQLPWLNNDLINIEWQYGF
ncbi:contractile injection system tape measure protein [Pseudoalteromonas umbrosa]|uniref:contractile injection system tape measure protein n=1 Tax=Pseudoalteromonas umbrosa TaxID=3048489 RepID=UPI0024C34FC5|nr:contractile injection system tape measure protein [Pseudoalteromonas sp. B95]MDK1286623.1 contractile injection system tape measure protein [Pseudoalteromonas sp. B95]